MIHFFVSFAGTGERYEESVQRVGRSSEWVRGKCTPEPSKNKPDDPNMIFGAIEIQIAGDNSGTGTNKEIYRYLDKVRIGHGSVNHYKKHFVLDIFTPEGQGFKVRFFSPDKNRTEFLSYLKKFIKQQYNLDESTFPEETPAFLSGGVRVYDKVEKGLNRYAINAQERELIDEIRKFQPDLTQDMILSLLQNYPRTEIIHGRWIRGRFHPADIFSCSSENIDLLDSGTEGSMM